MKGHININDEVLVKYLLHEATETERAAVQLWLQQAGNKSYFDTLKLLWKNSRVPVVSTINVDEAWERFNARTTQPVNRNISVQPMRWLKAAAILLLLAGSAWLCRQLLQSNDHPVAQQQTNYSPLTDSLHVVMSAAPLADKVNKVQKAAPIVMPDEKAATVQTVSTHIKRNPKRGQHSQMPSYAKTDKFICNSTPCPVEICITQSLTCKSEEPAKVVATCSRLEPDQSGQLRYNAFKKIPKNCNASVEEITIKRITTGETIVLNADSKPATATDVYKYLTGQKTGDIIAGIFHTDCDNNSATQGLKLDNSYGSLILQ